MSPKDSDTVRTPPAAGSERPDPSAAADKPDAVEGEGNYTAARRHRQSVEQFVDDGKVEPAARDAAPDSAAEAEQLRSAEEAGRAHAKR